MSEHMTPGNPASSGAVSVRNVGAADAFGSLGFASSRPVGSGVLDGAKDSFRFNAFSSIPKDGLSLYRKSAENHSLLGKLDEESDSIWLM